jgi:hypothetical protein
MIEMVGPPSNVIQQKSRISRLLVLHDLLLADPTMMGI